ncbi:hypothetical protein MNB_SV-15-1093 [hydrothermal vent metagenome]|uniref:Uncharacterized protein n=1 Tax=hydrothermal vent metagenome TaxID=652676 RepID=A0A1W1EKX4_9ZZZZ
MFKRLMFLFLFQAIFLVGANAKSLYIQGYTSYDISRGNINISVDKIFNKRKSGRSGTLKLAIWLTDYPYSGGTIRGFVIGETILGELEANRYYENISETVKYYKPPRGRYYSTFVLSEYRDGRYLTVDYVTYDNRKSF